MTQNLKIKVKVFLKSSPGTPGTCAHFIYSGLSRDDVYKMCINFMNKPFGTLKPNGTRIEIQEIK